MDRSRGFRASSALIEAHVIPDARAVAVDIIDRFQETLVSIYGPAMQ